MRKKKTSVKMKPGKSHTGSKQNTQRKSKRKQDKRKRTLWKLRFCRIELVLTLSFLFAAFLIIRSSVINRLTDPHPESTKELQSSSSGDRILPAQKGSCGRPEIRQFFLEPNEYSRSRIALNKVRGLVIHYVANPGSSAIDNREYFNSLKDSHVAKASSHFIIGLSGEIIQCIPLNEISYASNRRNMDTISIECCHPAENGKFSDETYHSLIRLACWLCHTYGLDSSSVIRHYDVTGKLCPVYYVKNQNAWDALRQDIQKGLKEGENGES